MASVESTPKSRAALKTITLVAVICFSAALYACSDPPDANQDVGSVGDTGGGSDTPGAICADKTAAVRDSIRDLARNCATAADCQPVERAGACACAAAFNSASDLTAFESSLAELDADTCNHPLRCFNSADRCDYASIFENPELITTCEAGSCGLAEVLECSDYVAKSRGGVLAPMACTDDAQCGLRNDLNPCGCFEAANTSFPFLFAERVFEMIDRNLARCELTCQACPGVTNAVCRNDVCVAE